jgi:superfamily II DNA/RNA helicase
VCTDLAARGLDVPGVSAVVQLQFAGNAVAHLHRMGRCGRAAAETGRGVVYYGAQESDLVRVLMDAELQQEQASLQLAGEVKDESAWRDEGEEGDNFDRIESSSRRHDPERLQPEARVHQEEEEAPVVECC